MPSRKPNRAQRGVQARKARAAAIEAAHRRRARRQRIVIAVMGLVVVGGGLLAYFLLRDDDTKLATDGATSIEEGAPAKPCVKVADPLPAGAPEVAVEVGDAPTTLIKRDLKEGTGAVVKAGDQLTVNYIGVACSTGKIFDATYTRGQPANFALDGVIPGWQQGIPGMKVGGQRLLGIPGALGYGDSGNPQANIGPNEALWFVVDVVEATAPPAAPPTAPS